MTVPFGRPEYTEGSLPCSGFGLSWTDSDLNVALKGPIASVLFDDVGKADIQTILRGVVETEFEQNGLQSVLADQDAIEDWQVGEAIAEVWLTDHRNCHFPWPDGRDVRKRGSSLPGADLVGFCTDSLGECLAFGEVKVSSDTNYPPGNMYGRTGLKRQLEDLRDNVSVKDDLFKYLGFRANSTAWLGRFRRAAKRYLVNKSDIRIFGFLNRDVAPNKDDVRARVVRLDSECPEGTQIELLALYLPDGQLNGIGNAVVKTRSSTTS